MQQRLHLPNPDDWLSVAQAVDMLGISRDTLGAMIRDGRLTGHHIGRHRVLWRPEVTELAAALTRTRARN